MGPRQLREAGGERAKEEKYERNVNHSCFAKVSLRGSEIPQRVFHVHPGPCCGSPGPQTSCPVPILSSPNMSGHLAAPHGHPSVSGPWRPIGSGIAV